MARPEVMHTLPPQTSPPAAAAGLNLLPVVTNTKNKQTEREPRLPLCRQELRDLPVCGVRAPTNDIQRTKH